MLAAAFERSGRTEKAQQRLEKILGFWSERCVFDGQYIESLRQSMVAGNAAAQLQAALQSVPNAAGGAGTGGQVGTVAGTAPASASKRPSKFSSAPPEVAGPAGAQSSTAAVSQALPQSGHVPNPYQQPHQHAPNFAQYPGLPAAGGMPPAHAGTAPMAHPPYPSPHMQQYSTPQSHYPTNNAMPGQMNHQAPHQLPTTAPVAGASAPWQAAAPHHSHSQPQGMAPSGHAGGPAQAMPPAYTPAGPWGTAAPAGRRSQRPLIAGFYRMATVS